MQRFTLLLGALLLAAAFSCPAKERRKRPAPVVSPVTNEDGTLTFRVRAPSAEKVQLSGEMLDGRLEFEKSEEGIWEVTIESPEPGVYGYSFVIDGLQTLDSGNPLLKPMRSPRTSILHVPGENPWDFADVPHGTVHYHSYHSKPIDRVRELHVYTPPGYETSEAEYPLLVLQHGHSDTFATWVTHGRAHWILDNLIAAGEAEPMIVLMLDGHPIPGSYGNGRSPENTEELRLDLLEAALPLVENKYRVRSGREHRAIAGLSMGGLHALTIGFSELDTFSMIGSFSGAIPAPGVLQPAIESADATNAALDLLWIACGKKDFLLEENEKLVERLKEGGIEHTWELTEGGHSWPIWRDYLARFVPLLFRE